PDRLNQRSSSFQPGLRVCHLLIKRKCSMFSSWFRTVTRKLRGRNRRRSVARSYHPRLELLEERTVLSFFTSPTFAVGTAPDGQAVGDFNGDGRADLVAVNQTANTMSVLLGSGDGTFRPKSDYATGTTPVGVAVGDFNGDGKLDVAVANLGAKNI